MQNLPPINFPTIYADSENSWSPEKGLYSPQVSLDIYEVDYLHYHSRMELGYCVQGGGICYVEDKQYPFETGDIQIVFPYQRHLSMSYGNNSSIWRWYTLSPVEILLQCGYTETQLIEEWLQHDMGLYGIIDRISYPQITDIIYHMFFPPTDIDREQEKAWLAGQLLCLISALRSASKYLPKFRIPANNQLGWISQAVKQIEYELFEGLLPSVTSLAKRYGASPASFRRNFKTVTGLSPRDYITICRMRKARHLLLNTQMKIIDISGELGYQDLSAFNRGFKKFQGISPSEFRKAPYD